MSEDSLDLATLRSDIHGEPVVPERICDYCGASLPDDGPVQYDIIRITDMPNVEEFFPIPDGWFPDAARCRDCERDAVTPATDGMDEALVTVHLAEGSDIVSVDASSLTIADYAPADVGYYPPKMFPDLIARYQDAGLVRWIRIERLFEMDDGSSDVIAKLRTAVTLSKEVPPGIEP